MTTAVAHALPRMPRIDDVLAQCSILGSAAGCAVADRTAALVATVMRDRMPAADATSRTRLCADGSPVELCERLAATPQPLGFTLDAGTTGAFALISSALRERFRRDASVVRTVWVGIDGEPSSSIRLYADLQRGTMRAADASVRIGNLEPDARAATVLAEIERAGALRVVGVDAGPAVAGGVKLAFATALDAHGLFDIARSCDVHDACFATYLRALQPVDRTWRQVRCGIGIALARTGQIAALTLYHYTAPYFRDDAALRASALALAERFGWDASVYRPMSRLLDDPAGSRVRALAGFTVRADGVCSLRMYGRSGHLG